MGDGIEQAGKQAVLGQHRCEPLQRQPDTIIFGPDLRHVIPLASPFSIGGRRAGLDVVNVAVAYDIECLTVRRQPCVRLSSSCLGDELGFDDGELRHGVRSAGGGVVVVGPDHLDPQLQQVVLVGAVEVLGAHR